MSGCLSVYRPIYLWLLVLVDLGRFFSFLIFSDGGPARRKAATYTQNRNTE
jgi:hypothetical protein